MWRRHSDAVNTALLDRWLGGGWRFERALKTDLHDEGVSDGLYPALAERAEVVVGIDLNPEAVRSATARNPGLEATRADVRELPFEDASFDLIVSNSTLDHFDSRDQIAVALAELRRVLKQSAPLVLTLDNVRNPMVALRNALPARPLRSAGLVAYEVGATLGPSGLREMLEAGGWEIDAERTIMHCPRLFAIAIARRVEARGDAGEQSRFLKRVAGWERLGGGPAASFSGQFVAALAHPR